MYFKPFRKLCQDYIRTGDEPYEFPSKRGYQELRREYNDSLQTAPVPDNDDTAGQFLDSITDWNKYMCNKVVPYYDWKSDTYTTKVVELAPLNVPCPSIADMECKQEGTTPMRYNDNYACASANIATQPSDTAVTRDYLLSRLARAENPKQIELTKLFNLYVDNQPKTYKELIDAIKNGTYTLDTKKTTKVDEDTDDDYFGYRPCFGPFFGIVWAGPVADLKGYEAAITEKDKQYRAAKDTIMVSDAAAGLAAIQAFEAWLPTPVTATVN